MASGDMVSKKSDCDINLFWSKIVLKNIWEEEHLLSESMQRMTTVFVEQPLASPGSANNKLQVSGQTQN